jgi:cytochrome c oxidase cbb3-type subunit 2
VDKYRVIFAGAVITAVFAFFILAFIPQRQVASIVPMDPLNDYTPAQAAGRKVYIAEGCVYCHTQQVRSSSFGSDSLRGWGRASFPEDYRYDRPHQLGTMRTGPDLMNIAVRQPSRDWHMTHLYQPRALVQGSLMPGFPYLFEHKETAATGDEVVQLPPAYAPSTGVIVAKPEARALVDYLLSLNRNYPRANMREMPVH